MRFLLLMSLCFILSCSQSKDGATKKEKGSLEPQEKLWEEIESLQSSLKTSDIEKPKTEEMASFVKLAESWLSKYPKDPRSPALAFRAADYSRGLGKFRKAIQLWGQIVRLYPNYEKAPEALLLQGFTYENDIKNTASAANYYNMFLEKYPKHAQAENVKELLKNLNKTPEQLLEEIKKKNKG